MKTSFVLGVLAAIAVGAAAEPEPAPQATAINPYEKLEAPQARGEIDRLVFAKLAKLGIQPANVCSDAVFVRRAYLDVIGTLPTGKEALAFIKDESPNKREALIDVLLKRTEFTDYWTMRWDETLRVKAEFPINLWPNAVQAYHRWIFTAIRDGMPYDKFARELLTANGSNFRVGPVNFYRAVQDKSPEGIAHAVAQTFLGERSEKWPKAKLAGVAGFFSQLDFKATQEWKEEIVFYDSSKVTNGLVKAAAFPDGTPAQIAPETDPRTVFADWLITEKNPWFARVAVNRVWAWLMGRGIIHEPDDVRADNPPSNPELLAYLQKELVAAKWDLRHIYRLILTSEVYQLSATPKARSATAEANFAYYPLRRLEAEVLIDALNQITGTTEKYVSAIPEPFTFIPEDQRAIQLGDGSISSSFLEMFGRPARDTGLASERVNKMTPDQTLHMLNSSHIQRKLEQSPKFQALMRNATAPREVIGGLYLMILSRLPTEPELRAIASYAHPEASAPSSTAGAGNATGKYGKSGKNGKGGGNKGRDPVKGREAALDVAWALINSQEFLYRH
jgi:hypothetical protein